MKSADREHYGLAVYCARRFQGRGVPMEELIAEGEAALLWAASRFDEGRGVRFSTYAIPVVLGALRELCRRAHPMHVPREDMRLLSQAAHMRDQLCERLGREPDVRSIAAEMGVEAQKLGVMLAASERMRLASGMLDASMAPEACFEDELLLRDAIRRLPRPYAQVVWLRYGAGASQAEIARSLGVGQPQISRWEKKGLALLREQAQEI